MKKIMLLVLAVAVIAVPAWAVVNITATVETVLVNGTPADTDMVVISYEVIAEANNVRAFGLDITVQDPCGDPNADPHIVDIIEYELNADYWVYPGSIDINEAGEVNDVGTPVADPCGPVPIDTLPGIGSYGITIEMGSLYVGEANAPDTSGVLLKFVVDDNCLVNVSDNVSRGGVVMEGGGAAPPPSVIPYYFGTTVNMYTHTDIAQWRAVGRPKCWCRFKGGRQCHGDADGKPYGKNNYWVSIPEADLFNAANTKPISDFFDVNGLPVVDPCTGIAWICGDTDHVAYGKLNYRISVPEADTFNTYNSTSSVPQDCP
jgi:hypothetical protein